MKNALEGIEPTPTKQKDIPKVVNIFRVFKPGNWKWTQQRKGEGGGNWGGLCYLCHPSSADIRVCLIPILKQTIHFDNTHRMIAQIDSTACNYL